MSAATRFSAVRFDNFKTHESLTIGLSSHNVLVGGNNCGKSTIIAAFRTLSAGLRTAFARSAEPMAGPESTRQLGWHVPADEIPMSLENVHTNYNDSPASVEFRLSNGNRLLLWFPGSGRCSLFASAESGLVRTPTQFKSAFPVSIGVVPVLGPVEHKEEVVEAATVRRNLHTHRASRNFRNYWHHNPEGFPEFAALLAQTWPGMTIKLPARVVAPGALTLEMFCSERRFDRELYWVGFGFQIWCQILTHLVRSKGSTLFVVDEPETYLHPDVQRQLVGILRREVPAVLMATHSSEIIAEAEPDELVLVEPGRRKATRIGSLEHIQRVLDTVGSIHNLVLTRLARSRRVLFVEGDDFRILSRIARKLRLAKVGDGAMLTVVPIGGFDNWQRVTAMGWGLSKTLGQELFLSIVLDRDYRSEGEIEQIREELMKHCKVVHVLRKKEIENYLLLPTAIQRVADRQWEKRNPGVSQPAGLDCEALILSAADELQDHTRAQYLAKLLSGTPKGREDQATVIERFSKSFADQWKTLEGRVERAPGKSVLNGLNNRLMTRFGVSVSGAAIIDAMQVKEVPDELRDLLVALEQFCA